MFEIWLQMHITLNSFFRWRQNLHSQTGSSSLFDCASFGVIEQRIQSCVHLKSDINTFFVWLRTPQPDSRISDSHPAQKAETKIVGDLTSNAYNFEFFFSMTPKLAQSNRLVELVRLCKFWCHRKKEFRVVCIWSQISIHSFYGWELLNPTPE